jgi:thiopeptide-type bacteriocin biosynthesis protein
VIAAPRPQHDAILLRTLAPLIGPWREDPALDSLFFVRYSEPDWQLRFRVLGDPAWIDRVVRPAVAAALHPLLANGTVTRIEDAVYDRELARYGGARGMRLAEAVFHADSLAVLDWLALEHDGRTRWSRREFSLLLAEAVADLFAFTPAGRQEFYRQGYQWAFDSGLWGESARGKLAERADSSRVGLDALLDPAGPRTGSDEERALLARVRAAYEEVGLALRNGLGDGTIDAHAPHLAWSLAHMSTNRLGIDPAAEAILRWLAGHR